MKLPYIILVDDDQQVLRAIHDILNKYREDYKVAATESANSAGAIKELKLKNETALIYFQIRKCLRWKALHFEKANEIFPMQKILLTAYFLILKPQ